MSYSSPCRTRALFAPRYVSKQKLNHFLSKDHGNTRVCVSLLSHSLLETCPNGSFPPFDALLSSVLNNQVFSESKCHIFSFVTRPLCLVCVLIAMPHLIANLPRTAQVHPLGLLWQPQKSRGILATHGAGLWGSTLHTWGEKKSCFLLSRSSL